MNFSASFGSNYFICSLVCANLISGTVHSPAEKHWVDFVLPQNCRSRFIIHVKAVTQTVKNNCKFLQAQMAE